MYPRVSRCLQMPEDVRCLDVGVTGRYELTDIGAGNQQLF